MICNQFNRHEISQKAKEIYYKENADQQLIQCKKEALQNKRVLFLLSIRMSEKTLKLDNIKVNKEEFHKSKQQINLDLINVDQIVVSDKFKHSDDGFKYFNAYKKGELIKPLNYFLISNEWIHKILWKRWQEQVFCIQRWWCVK